MPHHRVSALEMALRRPATPPIDRAPLATGTPCYVTDDAGVRWRVLDVLACREAGAVWLELHNPPHAAPEYRYFVRASDRAARAIDFRHAGWAVDYYVRPDVSEAGLRVQLAHATWRSEDARKVAKEEREQIERDAQAAWDRRAREAPEPRWR